MTMNLSDVRDWLKRLFPEVEHFYIGKLDRKQPKSIGVYSRDTRGTNPDIALGGKDSTKTLVKEVSILIHWNTNADETEKAGYRLFDAICDCEKAEIGGKDVDYLRLRTHEPVDVGTDNGGVYERVLWIDIYYQKG